MDAAIEPLTPMHWESPSTPGRHPGVVLFHEAFGVDDHIRSVASRLASEGFVVGAPSLFARLGEGAIRYSDHTHAVDLLSRLTNADILADARSAHDQLTARSDVEPSRVSALGFCFGGRCAFLAATELDLACAVSFYGPGIAAPGADGPLARAAGLGAPVLFVFGGLDPLIPDEARDRIAHVLGRRGKDHEIVTYPLAGHAFFNDARTDRYDGEAADHAWKRTLAFLRKHNGDGAVTA
jgi:carboxymethylenebutenolidase